MEKAGLIERLARVVVRAASALAPVSWRTELSREWEGELARRFRPDPPTPAPGLGGQLKLLYRSCLSLIDAAHLRVREFTMESVAQDIRFAIRSLRRRPAFTILVLATIGLGIGANTAIFTVVNSVLLRPLPYPEPDELVMVWEQDRVRGWDRVPGSAEDFLVWRSESSTMEAISGGVPSSFSLTGEGTPEQVSGFRVAAGFFDVFDVPPALGSVFADGSNVAGQEQQVVLSHGLWQRRFGGDPSWVGRTVEIDGASMEVVGIMPEGFQFPSSAQLWAPLVFSDAQLQDRNWHFLLTVGRLAEGSSIEAARAELRTIASRLGQEFPDSNADFGIEVQPLHLEMTNAVRTMLWVLLGAVGFVLLIACANVANLLLVRATARSGELSLRTALGAGRSRLIRQVLTESVLLAGGGAVLGLGIALLGLDALLAISPVTVPGGGEVTIDRWVLGVTVAGAVVTGLLFGLAPALAVWKTEVAAGLREGRDRSAGGGRRLRSALVVSEIALALVLVTGAGLMVQSVRKMLDVDVGVDTKNALVGQFSLPAAEYPGPAEQVLFYDELLTRASAIPGVEAAALSNLVPPAGGGQYHVRIEGVHEEWTMDLPVSRTRAVSTNYIETMGIPVLRGRAFVETDDSDGPMVVVVDQAFADQHFPSEDPIGRQIRTLLDAPREIVGVVGNVTNAGLQNASGPTVYFPYAQHAFGNSQTLILRTASDPTPFTPALQEAIWSLDSDLPLVGVATLEDRLSNSVAQPRFNSLLLSVFGGLAALLAAIGIYGVMAYSVSQRTTELGLRMALGASKGEVRGLILRSAVTLAVSGVVVGLVASIGLTRTIEGFLFGVEATDPLTLGMVAVGLCAVAVAASLIPAVRASRLEPVTALRED